MLKSSASVAISALVLVGWSSPPWKVLAAVSPQMIIAVIGDYGCLSPNCEGYGGQQEVAVANLVHSWSPDAILTVGDNSYENGTASEIPVDQQPYAADVTAGRLYPVAGNHDWGQQCSDPTHIQNSTSYFGKPPHYTAHFGSGLLDFFATDMNCAEADGYTYGSAQAVQYQSDVAASTAVWKVTGSHQAFYSSGAVGTLSYTHWGILPAIDLFLSGHDHDSEHLVEGGQHFVVDGAGGAATAPLGPPIPGSIWSDGQDFAAVRLTVTPSALTVDFISAAGALLHTFTLTKGSPASGTITGTVTDPAGGQGIAGARVSDGVVSATTDANGSFTIANVAPGTYSLTASAVGRVAQSQVTTVTSGATDHVAFSLGTPAAQPPPAGSNNLTLDGIVTDIGTRQPISGATVSFGANSTTTGTGGGYGFSGVSPGQYSLTASSPGYGPKTQTVALQGPLYVQGAVSSAGTGNGSGATSVSGTLPAGATQGNRIVVAVRVDSSPSGAVVGVVTDSAGNVYTQHVAAANSQPNYQSQVTIWSAVVLSGPGTALTVTATATSSADMSMAIAEYSGLSAINGSGAVDQTAGSGATGAPNPASGPTAGTTQTDELAVGAYGDGGSNLVITEGAGWSRRINDSPSGRGTVVLEDQMVAAQQSTPNAQFSNASPSSWAVAEAVFKPATTGTHDFALSASGPPPPPSPSSSIALTGIVTNSGNGQPIAGTTVSVGALTTATDATGNYTINGLSPGSATVTANASGYQGQSRTVMLGPAYVQGGLASAGGGNGAGATSVSLALANPVASGDRVVVAVRVDSNPNGALAQSVSDSAGNVYTKHVTASNNRPSGYQAQVTIWSAVITAGAGAKLTVTATATASADLSVGVAEYSGLSTVSGSGAVDQTAGAGGVSALNPASGSTAATTGGNELAVGAFGDGGSDIVITAGSGWHQRLNNSPNGLGTVALEDQLLSNPGATPNAQWSNASANSWAVAEVVFKGAPAAVQNFALIASSGVNGTVKNAATGQPIAGATVSYSGGSTATDSTGTYGLTGMAPGTYNITVSATGFLTQTATVALSAGTTSVQNFSLSPSPSPSPVAVAYVQGGLASAGGGNGAGATSVSLALANPVASGDRVVVAVRVDSNPNGALAQSVSDSAGNVYTKHVTASNNRPSGYQAQVTIWSAVITAGAGAKLTVTATATASADLSVGVAEYSGLSTVSGSGAVDQTAGAGGVSALNPASGSTAATTGGNELAVGAFGDGGSDIVITAGSGWHQRLNNSPNGLGTVALEDQLLSNPGATPNAQWSNASANSWAVAEVVFKGA